MATVKFACNRKLMQQKLRFFLHNFSTLYFNGFFYFSLWNVFSPTITRFPLSLSIGDFNLLASFSYVSTARWYLKFALKYCKYYAYLTFYNSAFFAAIFASKWSIDFIISRWIKVSRLEWLLIYRRLRRIVIGLFLTREKRYQI